MPRPRTHRLLPVILVATAAACGGDGSGPTAGARPVASVDVGPARRELWAGDAVQLAATTRDAAGGALAGRAVTWTSSDASVAAVSATGALEARGAGEAIVTATSEGKSAAVAVRVSVAELLFEGWAQDVPEIFLARVAGAAAARLLPAGTVATDPTPSPDGTRIAFRRSSAGLGSDVAVIATEGGPVTRLVKSGEQRMPAWSPDGRRIAYVEQQTSGSRADIFTVLPDGSGVTAWVEGDALQGAYAPAWLRRRAP